MVAKNIFSKFFGIFAVLLLGMGVSFADDWYVYPGGTNTVPTHQGCYNDVVGSIQGAVAAAASGDNVIVCPGRL